LRTGERQCGCKRLHSYERPHGSACTWALCVLRRVQRSHAGISAHHQPCRKLMQRRRLLHAKRPMQCEWHLQRYAHGKLLWNHRLHEQYVAHARNDRRSNRQRFGRDYLGPKIPAPCIRSLPSATAAATTPCMGPRGPRASCRACTTCGIARIGTARTIPCRRPRWATPIPMACACCKQTSFFHRAAILSISTSLKAP
jgi:hypothetical protein